MFCAPICFGRQRRYSIDPFVLQGLTEPNHGSDPASLETTAEETDGGFIINGSKTWISNAPVAYVYISSPNLILG
jgi:alkylation response protein AidB-like acyl-CoA dehydrogenase